MTSRQGSFGTDSTYRSSSARTSASSSSSAPQPSVAVSTSALANIVQAGSPPSSPGGRVPRLPSSPSSSLPSPSSERTRSQSISRRLLAPLVRTNLRGLSSPQRSSSSQTDQPTSQRSVATLAGAVASARPSFSSLSPPSRILPATGRSRSARPLASDSAMANLSSSPGTVSLGDVASGRGDDVPTSPAASRPKRGSSLRKTNSDSSVAAARARARSAQKENDSMVYLDGPQVYTCAQCRTHLTSHDDIISKSFHGRHGRAYLFDQCVNVTIGPAEDRLLITGLHSVCDIFCKRCKGMVGWTYAKAYESSQKYKEGKFIIEKINLHLEESDYYDVSHPAGERCDRWRRRTMSWGSDNSGMAVPSSPRTGGGSDMVYEYRPASAASGGSPHRRARSTSLGGSTPQTQPRGRRAESSSSVLPPAPPFL